MVTYVEGDNNFCTCKQTIITSVLSQPVSECAWWSTGFCALASVAGANDISGERALLTWTILEPLRVRFAGSCEGSLVKSLTGSLWGSSPDARKCSNASRSKQRVGTPTSCASAENTSAKDLRILKCNMLGRDVQWLCGPSAQNSPPKLNFTAW